MVDHFWDRSRAAAPQPKINASGSDTSELDMPPRLGAAEDEVKFATVAVCAVPVRGSADFGYLNRRSRARLSGSNFAFARICSRKIHPQVVSSRINPRSVEPPAELIYKHAFFGKRMTPASTTPWSLAVYFALTRFTSTALVTEEGAILEFPLGSHTSLIDSPKIRI
jgi:hypothetical protein